MKDKILDIDGKKTIRYKDKDYFIKKLVAITKDSDLNHNYKDGDCIDLISGETFDIKDLDKVYIEKYKSFVQEADITGYNKKSQIKRSTVDVDFNFIKLIELEDKFKQNQLTVSELKELINIKYGDRYNVFLNYENFIKINQKIPDLSDADLGKFYKILTRLTYKANTLLIKTDVRSNPLTKKELCELLGLELKAVEQYLKRLKDKNILKYTVVGDKKHWMVNPLYAFNGNVVGSYTYINFKEEVECFAEIPEELKMLWEYEYTNSNIEDM